MANDLNQYNRKRHYIVCRLQVNMFPNNRNGTLLDNDNDMICVTDIVFLRYMTEGITNSGMLTVDFEYSSSQSSINYLDVQYSDPQMRKHVEDNRDVMRNIDSHLKNNLLYQEYNIR